jgi:tRNA threonylcarbamoyl adenosine modification protein YeaZ
MIHAALDTSAGFTLAILDDDRLLLKDALRSAGRDSDRMLLPWLMGHLETLNLKPADVRAWSAGIGPGSFAGLRCGIAVIKGIATVTGARLRGVPSSCAIAAAAAASHPEASDIVALHDGRCGQVIAVYMEKDAAGAWHITREPAPVFPEELEISEGRIWATMQPEALPELPEAVAAKLVLPEAMDAAALANAPAEKYPWPVNTADQESSTTPLYVRQAVFVKPAAIKGV